MGEGDNNSVREKEWAIDWLGDSADGENMRGKKATEIERLPAEVGGRKSTRAVPLSG